MLSYEFTDALTGASLKCDYPGMQALKVAQASGLERTPAIFLPGCSLLNYGLPLVGSVLDLLKDAGVVQGASLLCCGKILSYEPDGQAKRSAYEAQLREHILAAGVELIVTACPNCTVALRALLAADSRTADVQVKPLPAVLAELGYRIDAGTARAMLADAYAVHGGEYAAQSDGPALQSAAFAVHDSCPDRDLGEFADGIRTLLGEGLVAEMEHSRARSTCCGSLVRAAGKPEAAVRQSLKRGQEAQDAGALAIACACISCAYLLSAQQKAVPVFHYLELLYNWRIDWHAADEYMKLRFLFEDSWGVTDATSGAEAAEGASRSFVGLCANAADPREA